MYYYKNLNLKYKINLSKIFIDSLKIKLMLLKIESLKVENFKPSLLVIDLFANRVKIKPKVFSPLFVRASFSMKSFSFRKL